ncbi:TonB-dependent receptor [Aquimarina celericrescens]|uniref:Carboxypeptidase regulatory-like domain-containing protein n=1 Tax=Aquimarina celericrescens TaxID=1964542 RepID=A0ABW5AWE2_9FLAO|nr:TonB-dependent receptor [Aquimarina celericrescens]
MKKITFLFVVILIAFVGETFAQGVTTSAMGGKVTDNTGGPLPGANVIAVHQPSGTTYGATTDFDGFYRISGMRTGGPYTVTISYVGFSDAKKENLFLDLGQTYRFSTQMQEEANALEQVVITVTNDGLFDSNKTGAETNVGQRQVNTLPSLSRNISDFARLTPQAQVSGDNQISIAGQNNRFNAIYIDGAVNNDVFGLAASGTNGGQTGVSPISLDAIESFQINVAPFDVKQSGFAGGSINAITRSGTNEFKGSAYYLFRNESLAGKTPGKLLEDDDSREKLDEFTAETIGVRVGGPIIEDKLFFFINYERQDNETPQPFIPSTYRGDSDQAAINNLANFLRTNYGYDPGALDGASTLVSDKLIAKIDWNINENNKLSLRHSYVKADQFNANTSNPGLIQFSNRSLQFESITNSSSLELNSKIGNNMANNLVLGYTSVEDNRDIVGDPFPAVQIFDGDGTIQFGSEPFSTANFLDQQIFTLTNNFEIYSGRHTITLGTNNEFSSAENLFFRQNFGDYRFNNLNDFLSGAANAANRYRRGYSLLGGLGDNSAGAADFNLFQFGLYAQDEVSITDNFNLSVGLRVDIPYWEDGDVNEDFNTRTVSLLEAAGKNLQGARVGEGIAPRAHISPRLGFNWDVNGDKTTQIRGGLGIFTSRVPLVWPGATYNNNGQTAGFIEINRDTDEGIFTPAFEPNVNQQFTEPQPGTGAVGGQVDLFASDFMLPQVMKYNIAIDQKLPAGFTISADFIYNDNINAVQYENLNLRGPEFTSTGTGARPNYGFNLVDPTYTGIFLASNTGEGSSYNISTTVGHKFLSSLVNVYSQFSYSYGDSEGLFDGTSSQNSSQWNFLETVNGSNRPTVSTSDFAQGHRFLANATVEFKWNENFKTRIGLVYEGAEGSPFSYVYNDRNGGLLADTGSSSALIYVPANRSEINLVDVTDRDTGAVISSAEDQWEALNAFIEGNDYLRGRRGQFSERNGDRTKWSHVIDLKFAQEFSIMGLGKKNTLEFTADIFNFTNLLNKDWGTRYFVNNDNVRLVTFAGFESDGTTPRYTFSERATEGVNEIDDAGLNSSRWQMQLGLRYTFN